MRARSVLIASALINLLLPAQAHDIYSHLTDQEGRSCCDERDCRPAPYRITPSGVKMFVDGEWIAVPDDTIQYRALLGDTGETGGGHWCGFAVTLPSEEDLEPVDRTHCAILPPRLGPISVRGSVFHGCLPEVGPDHVRLSGPGTALGAPKAW